MRTSFALLTAILLACPVAFTACDRTASTETVHTDSTPGGSTVSKETKSTNMDTGSTTVVKEKKTIDTK